MPMRHRHRVGRYLIEDEESGIVAYDDQIQKRWDGALVRRKAFETRHPQEFVRAKSDPKALKDVRPAQEAPAVSLGPAYRVGTTNVPAPKGIGYRLTRTGVGVMRIGGSFVVDGELDDVTEPAVSAAPLYWNPDVVCELTSPTTYHVSAGNTSITLSAGEHAIVVLGSGGKTINGYVHIYGEAGTDNRVQIIGGHIANNQQYDTGTADGINSHCLRFQRISRAYVEGVRFDKMDTAGDCIHFTATSVASGKLYVQNCLGIRINYQDPTLFPGHSIEQHGDFLQISAQVSGVYVDKCTFYSWRQGFIVNSSNDDQFQTGPAVIEGVELRRFNGHIYDTNLSTLSPQPTGAIAFRLQDDDSATPIPYTLDRVYIHDFQTPRDSLNRMVLPSEEHGQVTSAGINIWTDEIKFPTSTLITGSIRYGIPPDGDFVPLTFTGLNYSSPGYRT